MGTLLELFLYLFGIPFFGNNIKMSRAMQEDNETIKTKFILAQLAAAER